MKKTNTGHRLVSPLHYLTDSDWDILILLNKDKVELDDHDYISYPFFELGWNIDVQIHPILYTFKDWMERSFSPFYKNVEREGIDLC